jgi:hypothetical protein
MYEQAATISQPTSELSVYAVVKDESHNCQTSLIIVCGPR